jgi:hypothetical protein
MPEVFIRISIGGKFIKGNSTRGIKIRVVGELNNKEEGRVGHIGLRRGTGEERGM